MRCWHCGSEAMRLIQAWPDFYQAWKCLACDAGVLKSQQRGEKRLDPPPVPTRQAAGSGPRPAKILRGRRA